MIVGYTCGVYDIFHEGHVEILKNAKSMCDKLIVGLTTDELVCYKGKYPIMSFSQRKSVLESVKYVDLVVPQHTHDKFESWLRLKFDILFVGDDWYNSPQWNTYETKLKEYGVKVIYFPYTRGISTTLLKKHIVHPNNAFLIFDSHIIINNYDKLCELDYNEFLSKLIGLTFTDDIIRIFNYVNCNKLKYTILHKSCEENNNGKVESIFEKIGIDQSMISYGLLNKETITDISKRYKISPEFMIIYTKNNEVIQNNVCYTKLISDTLKWEDFIDGLYNTK